MALREAFSLRVVDDQLAVYETDPNPFLCGEGKIRIYLEKDKVEIKKFDRGGNMQKSACVEIIRENVDIGALVCEIKKEIDNLKDTRL